jgi:HNH endonuclease
MPVTDRERFERFMQKDRARFERFMQKVHAFEPGGCWLWDRRAAYDGRPVEWTYREHVDRYAQFEGQPAHRVSYEFFWAEDVPEGHVVHHHCGNPGCVNPTHLDTIPSGDHQRLHALIALRQREDVAARQEQRERDAVRGIPAIYGGRTEP